METSDFYTDMTSGKESGKAIKMAVNDIYKIEGIDNGFLVTMWDSEKIVIAVDTYLDALNEIGQHFIKLKRLAKQHPTKEQPKEYDSEQD
jgi:hypothetical protein